MSAAYSVRHAETNSSSYIWRATVAAPGSGGQGIAWHDVVTFDESWFYLSIDHELIWLPAGAPVLDRERHLI
jgi:hypothetical protein